MRPIIVANWKMNPDSLRQAKLVVKRVRDSLIPIVGFEVYICPPYPYLESLYPLIRLTSIKLGAQNIHTDERGACTGGISLPMINEWIRLSIVGHSERRALGETDKQINKKLRLIFEYGLKAILCIGESLEDFKKKKNEIILDQLREALKNISPKKIADDLIIAYEPIWAIGTGIPADPDYVEKNIFLIRQFVSSLYNKEIVTNLPVLYGGSVKADNISEFIKKDGINGFLVGGASVDPREFVAICKQTKEISK